MNKQPKNNLIGIRVDEELKKRLKIRAMRKNKTLSLYCYDLLYKQVYRDD